MLRLDCTYSRDELLRREALHDLDQLQVLISVGNLDNRISGYQAADDRLRANLQLDVGLSDYDRILATLSMADDKTTGRRLVEAVGRLVTAAPGLPSPKEVQLPDPRP